MALNPQAAQFLEGIASAGAPPMISLPVREARAVSAAGAERIAAPVAVGSIEDRVVESVGIAVPVRVYRPAEVTDGAAIVYFHGGGWVLGDLAMVDTLCTQLSARGGCVVVSVDYRLAPEHPFPAAVTDSLATVEWVFENADELGVDPTRVAVAGDSAGGNLATVVGNLMRDRDARPAFQMLFYPVTSHAADTPSYADNAQGYFLTADLMAWFWDHYAGGDERSDPRASPLLDPKLDGAPAAYVATAEYDPLRDEGDRYAQRLRDAGVHVTHHRFDGQIHSFVTRIGVIDDALVAIDEALVAFATTARP